MNYLYAVINQIIETKYYTWRDGGYISVEGLTGFEPKLRFTHKIIIHVLYQDDIVRSLSITLYNTMALQVAKSSAEVMEPLDINDDTLNKLNSVSDL